MLGQLDCRPSTKARQVGQPQSYIPQQTSCFHQFLSRCGMRSLETCTCNSVAKTYCSIMSITSQNFQINQSIPMQLVLLTISRTVTLTSALVPQQPASTVQPHQLPTAELQPSNWTITRHCNIKTLKQGNDTHFISVFQPISSGRHYARKHKQHNSNPFSITIITCYLLTTTQVLTLCLGANALA